MPKQSANCEVQPLDKKNLFFIISLPRSGTAWLANFLTWGDSFCYHEALFGCRHLSDLDKSFSRPGTQVVGNADTSAALLLPALLKRYPKAKFIFVIRHMQEVADSLEAIGLDDSSLELVANPIHWGVDNIENKLVVPFDRLFTIHTAIEIWNFIGIKDPFPFRRFVMLSGMRVQDGYGSNFGRFCDVESVQENTERFNQLLSENTHSVKYHAMVN